MTTNEKINLPMERILALPREEQLEIAKLLRRQADKLRVIANKWAIDSQRQNVRFN